MNLKTMSIALLCGLVLFQQSFQVMQVSSAWASSGGKKNANELAESADRAVAYIVKMGKQSKDKALSTSNKDAEPFWQAVKKINGLVSKIERSLFLKDKSFFNLLAETTAAVEEVKITYGMTRAKDTKVKAGIEKLDAAVSLLRENYSKEAARKRKGGSLSAAEKKKLEEIKDKQAELQRKLTELEGKVGKNETLIKGIKQIREKSHAVQNCNSDLNGFLFAMTAMTFMSGWMWGWHPWWGPWWGGWGPSFIISYNEIYVDFIDVIDVEYDWALAEDEILIDAELDLDVDLADAEPELMDEYLEESDFDVSDEEMLDFSADELAFEGEMDVYGPESYEDYDYGDFDEGYGDIDVGNFDDMGDLDAMEF